MRVRDTEHSGYDKEHGVDEHFQPLDRARQSHRLVLFKFEEEEEEEKGLKQII